MFFVSSKNEFFNINCVSGLNFLKKLILKKIKPPWSLFYLFIASHYGLHKTHNTYYTVPTYSDSLNIFQRVD